ncbi:flagellar hook-associated protein FlgK [Roseinatronobacter bogoriensis]|uniref:Flagellar hook-associated protein 1 n=1 Tax=Roseinatronobacter bogoriensis subsp. barguzinensis TaxID=441209 RepID=A0A2K8K5P0_9RHOB|nr:MULTISPECIES: flagellar hook-associated protein FlgK [Rhodobaca]ATX64739.1 flagellar hook-associated protein FlgK [Rhodobaca barguzinensis]MBB4208518.1 flagellar hook-associated protein 1 FlgK [Rhodobaca bogoriensis DSM 18756]TDW38213.1 flagellar hook-associated protein 1 FlgK [Rhodobaca barguzinensis]TDY69616.1 flagellar hook-associated protein 1 FlgK [Rhodobaca bogoriensis DSM 18756]
MSLSIALSSALSGLNVSARATQVVSDNIANAQTEGYGVRSLSQAARVTGSQGNGVMATGIQRDMDPVLLSDLRNATADNAQDKVFSGFWSRIEAAFGMPDEPGGLSNLIDALGVTLQNAAAQPESEALLSQVSRAAADISRSIGGIHDTIQAQRAQADSTIARDVDFLNQTLAGIADLNNQIQRQVLLGGAPENLVDARQKMINDISEIVSVQEIPRDHGRIMLMGRDGSVLVDKTASQFEFTSSPNLDAADSIENGALSSVKLNGRDLSQDSQLFSTGRIGASLEIRDKAAPDIQKKLDDMAYDLVARFGQPDLDPSLSPGSFGLFSLEGLSSLPTDKIGVSGRIALNPQVDPSKDGALWRLRNGMGLMSEPTGMVADNALLSRKLQMLNTTAPLSDGSSVARSVSMHASDALSMVATNRLAADQRNATNTARVAILSEDLAARGVDTDAELSKLLVLEQAYAANAKVIAAVDAMWRTMLEAM